MRNFKYIAILLLTILSGCRHESGERSKTLPPKAEVGRTAPEFMIQDLEEKFVTLSQFKGKVVILSFWKVRCKECDPTLASLQWLKNSFSSDDLEVISINVDNHEYVKRDKIAVHVREKGYSFRILIDDYLVTSELYQVIAAPLTFLIDRSGEISYIRFGQDDWTSEENKARIEKLLHGNGSST